MRSLVLLVVLAGSAHAERVGVTYGVDLGLGRTTMRLHNHYSESKVGLRLPGIQIGQYLRPDLALVLRGTCTTAGYSGESSHSNLWFCAFGLHPQWWFQPTWFVGPIIGLGLQVQRGSGDDATRGYALGARAGHDFAVMGDGVLQISFELVHVRYGESARFERSTSGSFMVGWQH